MNKLTPAQQSVLTDATERADGSIHPIRFLKGGAAKKVIDALRNKSLIDSDGMITESGRNAVDPNRQERLDNEAFATSMGREIPEEAPATTADEPNTNNHPIDLTEETNTDIDADEMYIRIARNHMPEDFRTANNWHWVRSMLDEAYTLGQSDAKEKKTKTATPTRTRENSKQAQVIAMLRSPEGATLEQMSEATGWNSNTVRGAMAGAIKKRLGLNVVRIPRTAGAPSQYRIE